MSDMLKIRIAANVLYRVCPDISINYVESDMCNLLCEVDGELFAVMVVASTFTKSPQFEQYVSLLEGKSYIQSENQIPIVLILINESTETVRMGIALGWRYMKAVINKDVTLHRVNSDTWSRMMENIKVMNQNIKLLSSDSIKIIKQISIKKKGNDGIFHKALIIYFREIEPKYKMIEKVSEAIKNDMSKSAFGIKQTDYPADWFDYLVLDMVKRKYESAKLENKLMTERVEYEGLCRILSNSTFTITMKPHVSQETYVLINKIFRLPQLELQLFLQYPYSTECFQNENIIYDVSVSEWQRIYDSYTLIKDTFITNVRTYIFPPRGLFDTHLP